MKGEGREQRERRRKGRSEKERKEKNIKPTTKHPAKKKKNPRTIFDSETE